MITAALLGASIIGGIANSVSSYKTMKQQNKIAKESLEFQKQNYEDEKQRIQKQEQEREGLIKSNDAFTNSLNAQSQNPTLRV